jgi:hypothetical protein
MQIGNLIYNKKYIKQMKHIKLFENFEKRKVYNLHSSELYQIEKWIQSVWDRLNDLDDE